MNESLILSRKIEDLLVSRNPRGMKTIQSALVPGYCLRAAKLIAACQGTVFIATGFPVKATFETDGPLGAVALYQAITALGGNPVLICGEPLASAIDSNFQVLALPTGSPSFSAVDILGHYQPQLIICIELPGRAVDGLYYNMRGVDISEQVLQFDEVVTEAVCPSIGIGDGGNETGMGNVTDIAMNLGVIPSKTGCDELVVADVSNWAAHGLVAMLSVLAGNNLLAVWDNRTWLQYFLQRGSVDGVTGEKTLTEDGMTCEVTDELIAQLSELCGL
jgi:hypothetical protein